jgi:hypothetical protein
MSEKYPGGFVTYNPPTPSQTSATGIWTLSQQQQYQQAGLWPNSPSQISRSLRFSQPDSTFLARTPASAGSRTTWTLSGWFKGFKSNLNNVIYVAGSGANQTGLYIDSANQQLNFYEIQASSYVGNLVTTQVFRDYSAWYHIVAVYDSTQATASSRMRLYVNGTQVTVFGTATYVPQNTTSIANSAVITEFGNGSGNAAFYDGYMANIQFVDGQALTPTSFGEYNANTGVWQPLQKNLTYGTNGFQLTFNDNTNTTATTLGADSSGNGNNWTPSNFSVTAGVNNDSFVDSPTPFGTDTGLGGEVRGNYCTLNPLFAGGVIISTRTQTVSNGNLYAAATSNSEIAGTFGASSSKWYFETTVINSPSADGFGIGFYNATTNQEAIYRNESPAVFRFGGSQSSYGATFVTGDIVGCALDIDNTSITFYVNGVSQGVAKSNLPAGTYIPFIYTRASLGDTRCFVNFGQRAFAYTAPSGYKALCTQNLPTPTIGATTATQAGKFFNPVLYTGNGGTLSVSGVGFQPDLVWLKARSVAYQHGWFDAVRGATKEISSNSTSAEGTFSTTLTSFDSDGFALGSNSTYNNNTSTFVAWNWKANGSGSTNTAGSITSTVSANTTSGFSVVTYTGNGTNGASVGHGLGVTPAMVIMKQRSAVDGWLVYHQSISSPSSNYLALNTTAASASASGWLTPSSSTLTFTTSYGSTNGSGVTMVAYCFAEVAGYSKFGSYTGNGSADGPFVYCGFRPAFMMIKFSSTTGDWALWDTKRAPYNAFSYYWPTANTSNSEQSNSAYLLDILSNGFKIRGINDETNLSGQTLIFMAFAESPFKYSLAR